MLQHIKLILAPLAWKVLRDSIRLPVLGDEFPGSGQPVILACLHRDILPAIIHVRPARPVLLVSNSPDGDILIRTLGTRDYGFVRGATGEGGQQAFKDLVRQVEAGRNVGVAVDGPKGPYGVINEGVFQLARLTGAPILPLVARPGRHRRLGTWDRTVVPCPLSRMTMGHGPLLRLPRQCGQVEIQTARRCLADFLGVGEESPCG
jgi:lysophospholipid acyltransferase (LPLAT)-like uncharacterized protein